MTDGATPTDEAMMRRALELAAAAAASSEVPVGAVIYETATGLILGEGANRRETDSDPTAHAEMIAIRAAARTMGDWRLNDCTLVITLEPCVMCAGAIVNARLGRVIYAATDPKAGAAESLYRILEDARLNHRVPPVTGLMATDAGDLLRRFFQQRRGRPSP